MACTPIRGTHNIMKYDEEILNIFATDWYKDIRKATTQGDTLKIYRENFGMTQAELGRKIGKFTRQKISDMEHNKRNINKEVAGKLSRLFDVPIERFI